VNTPPDLESLVHALNGRLGVIIGNLELLLTPGTLAIEEKACADDAWQAACQAAELIKSIRQLAPVNPVVQSADSSRS